MENLTNEQAFAFIKEKFKSPKTDTVEEFSSNKTKFMKKDETKNASTVESKKETEKNLDTTAPETNTPSANLSFDDMPKTDEEISDDEFELKDIKILDSGDPVYKFKINIRNKEILFRKWKVKDRKNIIGSKGNKERRKALVYDCLKDPTMPLDNEEYNFVLEEIRSVSVPDDLEYRLKCNECGEEFDLNVKIDDVINCTFSDYKPITYKDIIINVQDVANRDFYESTMLMVKDPYEKFVYDLALHIKAINGNSSITFKDVIEFLNNLDTDVFDEIFKQWNKMRFRCVNLRSVICPFCGKETLFNFNNFPSFFPKTWG